jgi:hypothetical protein
MTLPKEKDKPMTPFDLLSMGFWLFPVRNKVPLVRWSRESSNDPNVIARWIAEFPDCDFGINHGLSGTCCLDDDSGKNPEGETTMAILDLDYGPMPSTFMVGTINHGVHYIYRGELANTQGSQTGRPGVDTKGPGGYTVAPCSQGYSVISNAPITPVPEWLVSLVGKPSPHATRSLAPIIALDENSAIALAIRFLTSAEPAIQGQAGDKRTFLTACRVKDFGVSQEQNLELMLEFYNPDCLPPWSDAGMAEKVRSAYNSGKYPPGIANPEAFFTVFEDPEPPGKPVVRDRISEMFIDGYDLIRQNLKINYLIDGLIETPTTGLIFGDSTVGKTFTAIDMSLSVVFGVPWMGGQAHQGRVLYFNGEGHVGFSRRLRAWLQHHDIDDLPRGGITVTRRRTELTEASAAALEPYIKDNISKYGPLALIQIDTLAKHLIATADENSAKDISGYLNMMAYLQDRYEAVVATVHHSSKANKEISRGSSAIRGALDWEIKMGVGELVFKKQKDGEVPPPMGFAIKQIVFPDLSNSAVIIPCQYDPTHGTAKLSGDSLQAYSVFQMEISQEGSNLIPRNLFRQKFMDVLGDETKANTKRQKFIRAEEALLQAGLIKIEGENVIDCGINALDSED